MNNPTKLYHGSAREIKGSLEPVLMQGSDYLHTRAAVFATARKDLASLFMFPFDHIASIGFEQDVAYICIWGTLADFLPRDKGGYLYVLNPEGFEKIGKDYEWQSFNAVKPEEVVRFDSVINGMMECGAQVYFINDDAIFDEVYKNKDCRAPILSSLISENQKTEINFREIKVDESPQENLKS